MFANSPPIESTQQAAHPRLREIVQRHLRTAFRHPVAATSAEAFAGLAATLAAHPRPLVLDSGCGTGASTLALARQFPACWVIGVDKSAARLAQGRRQLLELGAPHNAVLLRCELVDLWLLAARAGWSLQRHYLLYPNPWPKPEHLQRRWHAHAIWPTLLALGGELELRCNWRVYAEEFVQALDEAGIAATVAGFAPDAALTPFERKYQASAHALWRCAVSLPIGAAAAGPAIASS